MYYLTREKEYGDGDTPDLVLDCGGAMSFTEPFAYLGSFFTATSRTITTSRPGSRRRLQPTACCEIGSIAPGTCPSGTRARRTRVVCSRCCSTAASPGASQRRLSCDSAPGTRSESERCAAAPCARRPSTASLPGACSSAPGC